MSIKQYRDSNQYLNNVQIHNEEGGAFYHAFKGIRNDYPPSSYDYLKKNRDSTFITLNVFRRPVSVEKVFNLITAGKWNEVKDKYGYDAFFHVGIIAVMSNGQTIVIEKNHIVNIAPIRYMPNQWGELKKVGTHLKITLGQFMSNTEKKMGSHNMFHYSAFQYNCQNFLLNALSANGLLTPELQKWIYQPIDELIKEHKGYVPKFANFVTNLGGVANRVFEGDTKRDEEDKIKEEDNNNEIVD